MKYEFIKDNPEYPVAKWTKVLKIERTGYYAWITRREACKKKEMHLKNEIKKEFKESRNTYGSERIAVELRKKGEHLGRKKCAGYMADMGLDSCHNRHKTKSLTNSKKSRGEGFPNILRYQEFPLMPKMGVTSDITYLRTGEGFTCHCVIKDIVTGEVLGDYMADRMTDERIVACLGF